VRFTHEFSDGMHAAIVQAKKPARLAEGDRRDEGRRQLMPRRAVTDRASCIATGNATSRRSCLPGKPGQLPPAAHRFVGLCGGQVLGWVA